MKIIENQREPVTTWPNGQRQRMRQRQRHIYTERQRGIETDRQTARHPAIHRSKHTCSHSHADIQTDRMQTDIQDGWKDRAADIQTETNK